MWRSWTWCPPACCLPVWRAARWPRRGRRTAALSKRSPRSGRALPWRMYPAWRASSACTWVGAARRGTKLPVMHTRTCKAVRLYVLSDDDLCAGAGARQRHICPIGLGALAAGLRCDSRSHACTPLSSCECIVYLSPALFEHCCHFAQVCCQSAGAGPGRCTHRRHGQSACWQDRYTK